MNTDEISLRIHEEVLKRCGTKWAEVSTDLSNDLLESCEELESVITDFIRDTVSDYEDRIKEELASKPSTKQDPSIMKEGKK